LGLGGLIGVVAAAAVIVVVVIAVVFGVPSIRKKVLPYRDRHHFQAATKD